MTTGNASRIRYPLKMLQQKSESCRIKPFVSSVVCIETGLPVVVSDWNGYQDTVRDDIDGLKGRG